MSIFWKNLIFQSIVWNYFFVGTYQNFLYFKDNCKILYSNCRLSFTTIYECVGVLISIIITNKFGLILLYKIGQGDLYLSLNHEYIGKYLLHSV